MLEYFLLLILLFFSIKKFTNKPPINTDYGLMERKTARNPPQINHGSRDTNLLSSKSSLDPGFSGKKINPSDYNHITRPFIMGTSF